MAGNETLSARNRAALDEWYTQLQDIEDELRHYRHHFRGKVVFCNCDDPYESNFFKYFAMNFNHLGLKRLITTCIFRGITASAPLKPAPARLRSGGGFHLPRHHCLGNVAHRRRQVAQALAQAGEQVVYFGGIDADGEHGRCFRWGLW